MSYIVNVFKISFNEVVPEILLCLKDSNAKTRDAAFQVILALAVQDNLVQFIHVILAALGAKTSHMRSSVVLALSRIIFEHGRDDEELQRILPQLLKTVLILVNEGSREVLKSVVGFVRICVSAIPRDELEPLIPLILDSLLNSHQIKSRFRAKVKLILKKLVKQFGYEALLKNVPESETRLLTHMRKLDERVRRKRWMAREDAESTIGDFDAMVDSDEEDSDNGRTLVTGASGLLSKRSRQTAISTTKSKSTKPTKDHSLSSRHTNVSTNFQIPDDDDGEVVDMLGAKMAKRVQFMDDASSSDESDGALEFDDDGRLVVVDEDDGNVIMQTEEREKPDALKRKKIEGDTTKRLVKKRKSSLGASYKSSKAGGDVKRKGQKFEPFAFVPLDGRAFSKKNRRTAVEQMSTIVGRKGSRK